MLQGVYLPSRACHHSPSVPRSKTSPFELHSATLHPFLSIYICRFHRITQNDKVDSIVLLTDFKSEQTIGTTASRPASIFDEKASDDNMVIISQTLALPFGGSFDSIFTLMLSHHRVILCHWRMHNGTPAHRCILTPPLSPQPSLFLPVYIACQVTCSTSLIVSLLEFVIVSIQILLIPLTPHTLH